MNVSKNKKKQSHCLVDQKKIQRFNDKVQFGN